MTSTRRTIAPIAFLVSILMAVPAGATHTPTQTLHGTTYGGADAVRLGLDSQSTATAAWEEQGGAYVATRPQGGFFGAPQTLAPNHVSELAFDEAPNGKAVVALAGGMDEGRLLVFVRSTRTGRFGPAQVLIRPDGPVAEAPFQLDVAISARGRAVVVYQALVSGGASVVGAVSDAEGNFSRPEVIDQPSAYNPRVDVDANGAATVVYDWDVQSGDEIRIASASRSGSFGQPVTLEDLEQGVGEPDIAVNPSGAAVIVYEDFVSDGECSDSGTCSRDKVEVRYGNVGGAFGGSVNVTDVTRPTATLNQEAALDDSGQAAVIFSASIEGFGYGIYAAVSDAGGSFAPGQFQAVSPHDVVTGPGADRRSFEIAAGGGEFTAFWSNDHNEDGNINEAWQASTSSGVFGEAHQLSATPGESAGNVHGGRNNAGDTVAGWQIFLDNTRIQVSPVKDGIEPYYATNGDDDLTGTKRPDLYYLRGGDDIFNARAGADRVYGGSGKDAIAGGGGADRVLGGGGNDALKGNGGDDTLRGGGRHDDLAGGGGPDLLIGGGGRDLLIGNAGFDVLKGGSGRDICVVDSKRERRRTTSCEIIRLR